MIILFVIPDSGQEHGVPGANTEQNAGTQRGWVANTLHSHTEG